MAVILVTGALGQLGSELKSLSKSYPGYEFIFTDREELDITDYEKVREAVQTQQPDWIINCAAYNLVDKAETDAANALLINSTAVKNIAESIKGSVCRFIHISSDYVFDGNSNVPYNENSTPAPLGEYGKSKLAGERAALIHNGSMVVRTSWLYSSYGSNFLKTIIRLGKERDSLNVVFDQIGTPTYAADLSSAIMNIVSGVIRNQVAFNAGIYQFSNEGVCSWYDFALAIVEEAGLNCKVKPILSKDFKATARRPFYSVLDKSKIKDDYNLDIPHWRESMKKCIALLK